MLSASLAIYFALLSPSSANAASRFSSWRQPSLLKRSFHKMEHDSKVDTSVVQESTPLDDAIFCLRGGGANGPCIGIDLGKSTSHFHV